MPIAATGRIDNGHYVPPEVLPLCANWRRKMRKQTDPDLGPENRPLGDRKGSELLTPSASQMNAGITSSNVRRVTGALSLEAPDYRLLDRKIRIEILLPAISPKPTVEPRSKGCRYASSRAVGAFSFASHAIAIPIQLPSISGFARPDRRRAGSPRRRAIGIIAVPAVSATPAIESARAGQ